MADPYFNRFLIHQGQFWDVYVSERGGNNLGRLYFWLHRDGIVDFDDLTDEEMGELLELHRLFKKSVIELFHPDGPLNFAYLSNEEAHGHHCHYHFVPRYKEPRWFEGVEFQDIAWGHQWQSKTMQPELAILVGKAIARAVLPHLKDKAGR